MIEFFVNLFSTSYQMGNAIQSAKRKKGVQFAVVVCEVDVSRRVIGTFPPVMGLTFNHCSTDLLCGCTSNVVGMQTGFLQQSLNLSFCQRVEIIQVGSIRHCWTFLM